jgi:uncharacterized protein YutE (UPF0331/DUF86 family)
MVDKAKLDQMLSNLRQYVGVLRELAVVPRESFLANRDKIGNAKYHFVIAIETCIDIANHVIASENYRFPKDNADSFIVLIEQGIVDAIEKDALTAMARFRNRLVHLYWQVEDERLYEYLQGSLADLDRFGQSVARHAR